VAALGSTPGSGNQISSALRFEVRHNREKEPVQISEGRVTVEYAPWMELSSVHYYPFEILTDGKPLRDMFSAPVIATGVEIVRFNICLCQ
jgi:hypothetical protein